MREAAPVEEAEEAAHHRHEARGRAALAAGRRAARRARRGNRAGASAPSAARSGSAAEMRHQEIEERGEIAPIGRARVRRGAALPGEPAIPRGDGAAKIRQRRRSARAAPARVRSEIASRRQVEPCRDGDAERAREEAKKLGPLAGVELAGRGACRCRAAPAGAAALTERRRIAAERTRPAPSPNSFGSPAVSAKSATSRSGPEHAIDGAGIENLHAVMAEPRAAPCRSARRRSSPRRHRAAPRDRW